MPFHILGVGTAVPAHTMSQAESAELATKVICQNEQQSRLLQVLYRKAGVDNRYTVLPHRIAMNWIPEESDPSATTATAVTLGPTTGERMQYFAECAPPLGQRAALHSLEQSGIAADEITHLVTVTCTGFTAPGFDVELINSLRLPRDTQRIQVGFMGCHGMVNGLRVAQAVAESQPSARVLVCAVELCSLHYRFRWDPERIVANALFADGAAAVVGTGNHVPQGNDWRVSSTGSCLIPNSTDAMTWRIGDHGFEMTLDARVPDLIRENLKPWISQWLDRQGLSLETIGSWAIHPGGPRILNAIEESLGLSREVTAVSREILANYGNMSSPTLLFIINRLREANAQRPCVGLGFGPGLVAEAVLLN